MKHSILLLGIWMSYWDSIIPSLITWSIIFTLQNFSSIRLMSQIPRPQFWITLSISDGFVKTKHFDKREDFDFDIVSFPFLDGDVPLRHPIVFIFFNSFVLL